MKLAGPYFLLQGAAVVFWWLLIAFVGAARPQFLPGGVVDSAFSAFAAPDVLVLAAASLTAGVQAMRRHPAAGRWAWVATGAALYAAVYTIAWTVIRDAPPLSSVLMAIAAVLSVWCARQIV